MNKDLIIIGGGPAGLSATISASSSSASVLLIEREASLGGILKQCIHDGFGLATFNERLSGPEYSERYIEKLKMGNTEIWTLSFVTSITKENEIFKVEVITRDGVKEVKSKAVILATGSRERSAKQVFIHGTRPSGVFTAGTAQYYVNIMGKMPTKKCIILGSGDIGLIMARRLTLEGAKVLGVYEILSNPSGLQRNIEQCLIDYNIPLHLSTTVSRVFGRDRLTAVEVVKVDQFLKPIKGTEEIIDCDALILSVGLIPENELIERLKVPLSNKTKGPIVDQTMMTMVDGLYSVGNSLQIFDLVDYVSENGEIAGNNAITYQKKERKFIDVKAGDYLSYVVPEKINLLSPLNQIIFYFRVRQNLENMILSVRVGDKEIKRKFLLQVRPPEMERLVLDLSNLNLTTEDSITFSLIKNGDH